MPDFTSGDPAASSEDVTNFVAPGNDDQQEPVTADNPVVLEIDGRKFTKNDLLKKFTNADTHIAKLEAERKSDFEKFAAMEAKLKELGDLKALIQTLKPGATPPVEPKVNDKTEGVDVEAAIKAALDARSASETAAKTEAEKAENWKTVTAALTKRYGKAETNARVAKAAEEAGLSVKEAAELAKSKPKAFLKLFNDLEAPKPNPAPARRGGTVNTAALNAAPATGPSGYAAAKTVKERVAIMQAAYAKHGL